MKIVAIANQKGGVGKTTTAVNLSAALAELKSRVLLIDLDPQGNATSSFGLQEVEGESVYGALLGNDSVAEKILPTRLENLFVIPADLDLAGAEIEIARMKDHLTRLAKALAAADELLTPIQCEYFALEGLVKIVRLIERVHDSGANAGLELSGILMTMFDGRTKLSGQVVAEVREHFDTRVYETVIPRSVRLSEAPSFGKCILEHDSSGSGAKAYRALAAEFLQRHDPAKPPSEK